MNFLHPSFLWALLFLAVPIVVHLFNLRKYKKEVFTNTAILRNFLNETQKTSKLKKRLLLACRLLALLCIIMAFVQPFLSSSQRKNGQIGISIYIDNSISMELPSTSITALEDAKKQALEIVHRYKNQAVYNIIANEFTSSELQVVSYQEAVDAIKNITITTDRKSLDDVYTKQSNILNTSKQEQKQYFWISDFQKNQTSNFKSKIENEVNAIIIPHNKKKNIYIDTAFIFSQAIKLGQDIKIVYKAKKSEDDQTHSSLISFYQNDVIRHRKEIYWNEKNEAIDTLILKLVQSDWQFLKLTISDGSLAYDNDYLFSFYLAPRPSVTLISQGAESKYIMNALKADNNFDVRSYNSLNISQADIQKTHLILLNQISKVTATDATWVDNVLQSGKNVAIFLPPNAAQMGYGEFLQRIGAGGIISVDNTPSRIKQINTQDALFSDVFSSLDKLSDLPQSSYYYLLHNFSERGRETLISFENSNPFLIKYSQMGEGNLYLFTGLITSDKSNFVYSSLFAPLIYKLGAQASSSNVYSYFISKNSVITIPVDNDKSDKIYKLVNSNHEIIPPQRKVGNALSFSLDNVKVEAGFYSLKNNQNETLRHIALNYPRYESDMQFYSSSELQNILGTNVHIYDSQNPYIKHSTSLSESNAWKMWVLLALLFYLLEMIISKFWNRIASRFNLG